MFFLIIIVKSHKQVLIKTILQDLLKDKTYLSFLWFNLYLLIIFISIIKRILDLRFIN
ncbi:hypothetical protein GZ527_000866 [Campylobacter jejuni]|nr:hypothetical protein [Campylobacter jejuni]EDP3696536.1 hypothetical protein [Campylobacter jejuni]EDP4343098.1 hypothetical protein [Campylobacter jejuni]EDP6936639.1 hypothetical protein [Campylobacter jejuni]